ncbi:MurR/RpiR family transcriptional regulator [Lactobacillus sp. ESL0679]|uniref:MurR/RpiR family transcriptional regulator n=1 Tax=Lactobacillus sp. ESL0679 TaxID=2983209 RepID=UPI0023F6792E|nr:MurR/RpiR family transcriptional regulator [Lactobacillus sp. ESL0679]
MDFEDKVKLIYDELTDSEKDIVDYIRKNADGVSQTNIVDVAKQTLTSKSSVLRLAKKLGYYGYSELKYSLKATTAKKQKTSHDLIQNLQYDIKKTFEYVEQCNFRGLIEKMFNAKTLIVYATGFSQANCAREFANDLFILGLKNYFVSGEDNLAITAENLGKDDLIIIIGLSGNTQGIKDTINLLNMNHVPICSITRLSENYLNKHSQYNLYYETDRLPSFNVKQPIYSYACLSILLSILSRKCREYLLNTE